MGRMQYLVLFLVAQAIFGTVAEVYQEPKCAGRGGTCLDTSCCQSNNYISNYCPTQPGHVKCCLSSDNCVPFLTQLQTELERDEGVVYAIYQDSEGHLTFGIGHLITASDPEYGLPVGTPVSSARVTQAFQQDVATTMSDCHRLYSDFDDLPREARLVISNMMFNLGYPRLSKFRNMKAAVDARDWDRAADEMVDSRWYGQVGVRAVRLVARMRALA